MHHVGEQRQEPLQGDQREFDVVVAQQSVHGREVVGDQRPQHSLVRLDAYERGRVIRGGQEILDDGRHRPERVLLFHEQQERGGYHAGSLAIAETAELVRGRAGRERGTGTNPISGYSQARPRSTLRSRGTPVPVEREKQALLGRVRIRSFSICLEVMRPSSPEAFSMSLYDTSDCSFLRSAPAKRSETER